MKIIFTILLTFLFSSLMAVNYYVANAGSDSNNGLTTGTAWQTMAKLSSFSFSSGDSIFLNKGDTWNERLNVSTSGIYFGSYGTGVKPLITGLQTITGFTNIGGNIWSVTATNSVPSLNTVLIGGVIRAKGRYPNIGYLTFTSGTKNQIVTSLSGTPNYAGAQCVVRTQIWVTDAVLISSQSGGTLNFRDTLTYAPATHQYFIQNIPSVLDIANEWSYDSTSKTLDIYSISSPTNVQISSQDTLVLLSSKNNVTFNGISFTGANKIAIAVDTSYNTAVINCTINNSGAIGILGRKSAYFTATNDSISNSLSNAIWLRSFNTYTPMIDTCNNASVTSNYINNTGIFAGMGMNAQEKYSGIGINGNNMNIYGNIIDSTGYIPVFSAGGNALIYKNFINTFCFNLDDGGGIYTVIGAYFTSGYSNGTIIRKNIVINGTGIDAPSTSTPASGIYLDDLSQYILVDSNTVSNCSFGGIYLHGTTNIVLNSNVVYNNYHGLYLLKGGTEPLLNLAISRNIFHVYGTTTSYQSVYAPNYGGTISFMTSALDRNYYERPLDETSNLNFNGTLYSLSGWQAATSQDAHSYGSPTNIVGTSVTLYYNPTFSDSSIVLPFPCIDSYGSYYSGTIILHSFSSILLYKAGSYSPSLTSKGWWSLKLN